MVWCQRGEKWIDRDVNATLELSARGRLRFDRSLSSRRRQRRRVARNKLLPLSVRLRRRKGWQVKP
jgi:hypothetical protein